MDEIKEKTEIQEEIQTEIQEEFITQNSKKEMRPWLKILINQLLIEMIFGFLSIIIISFIPILPAIAVIIWAAYIPQHKRIKYNINLSKKAFYILTFLPILTTIPMMYLPILILLIPFGFGSM